MQDPIYGTALRQQVITCTEIIADWTRGGLPLCTWTIQVDHNRVGLSGELDIFLNPVMMRDAAQHYAERLGPGLTVAREHPDDLGRTIRVTGITRGVEVLVWGDLSPEGEQ